MTPRTRSSIAVILSDSKKPFGFSGSGAICWAGSRMPSSPKAPVNADVPLRCMPRTMIA